MLAIFRWNRSAAQPLLPPKTKKKELKNKESKVLSSLPFNANKNSYAQLVDHKPVAALKNRGSRRKENEESKDKEPPDQAINQAALAALNINHLTPKEKYRLAVEYNAEAEKIGVCSYHYNYIKQKAIAVFRQAADEGHGAAMLALADILKKEPKGLPEAERYYLKLLKIHDDHLEYGGKTNACCELGGIYEKGGDGVEKNEAKAVKYYEMAIQQGSVLACYPLALLLEKGGEGFAPDIERAFDLLNKRAKYHMDSKFALARFFEEGKGTEKNIPEAINLYQSIANCHKNSAYRLGQLYMSGYKEDNGLTVIPQDLEKSLQYFNQARLLGHPKADKIHGRLYFFLKQKNSAAIARAAI